MRYATLTQENSALFNVTQRCAHSNRANGNNQVPVNRSIALFYPRQDQQAAMRPVVLWLSRLSDQSFLNKVRWQKRWIKKSTEEG